jgi:hypothetical protein
MGRRIEISRTVEREVYLHNILEDLLLGINLRFDELVTPQVRIGWKSQAVNGVIIMAMLNEGWINAIGHRVIEGWDPEDSAKDRLKKVRKKFFSELAFNKRPLSSVVSVRLIRNEFAHAKPLIETRPNELVTIDESDQRGAFQELHHPVESQITVETYRQFREDSETFRQLLLRKSGLGYWDLKTKSSEHSTFIKEAE